MLYTNLFFYNNNFAKNNENFELIDLMEKACFLHKDNNGIFSILSLGVFLQKKIINIIEDYMYKIGFSEVKLSLLQNSDLWKKSERLDVYGEELFKVNNRKNKLFCLSATSEELITSIYYDFYQKQYANCNIFQISTKFRDEIRARAGLIRSKEFLMKDGYSFNSNQKDLDNVYETVKNTYLEIFKLFNLNVIIKQVNNDEIGGYFSEEFLVKSSLSDNDDGTIEIAHIFKLGDTYSKKFNLIDNNNNYVQMCCYGIGVSRLLMILLEKQRDKFGFYGSKNFYTFDFLILSKNLKDNNQALILYNNLIKKGYSVLLDDRLETFGKKLYDSELICIKNRILLLNDNKIELLNRETMEKIYVDINYNF